MGRLVIEFSSNRDRCGRLTLFDGNGSKVCGPFPVAGRASGHLAAANGNPSRDPLFRYGDTPSGGYAVRRLEKSGQGTPFPPAQFGPHGVVVLEGILGEAACAEANGRFHILICGGRLSAKGLLRSTAGGLRLNNEDHRVLVAALRKRQNVHCDIVERESLPNRGAVFDDPACGHRDPPLLPVRESRSRHLSREVLRGGAAGAMMFSFTVSFVALQGAAPAHAATLSAAQSTSLRRDMAKMPPPGALPARPYVRMAYNTGGAAPAGSAMQQLQNATSGHQTTNETFDNDRPGGATPSGGDVSVPDARPAQTSEPPVTPQQQQMLDNDRQYQQYEDQLSNAQKTSDDAAAREQQIQSKIDTATDSAAKAQLQVDMAKARQDQSNADSAAAAAKINAQERKKAVIQGAPIKQD